VVINYDRPGVKGREGKIFGTSVVHEGFIDPGFGTSKAAPWRAGANENTTIEFSTEVKIEGQKLPAGKYGFFVAYGPQECTLIFSKNNSSWGHFFYDDKEDALRVKVKPVVLDKSVEWLKYEFINQLDDAATIALMWEKIMIPFKVEVDLFATLVEDYRLELRTGKGFTWEAQEQAAAMCLDYNRNLDEALKWSDEALKIEKNFSTLITNAGIRARMGQQTRADSLMREALNVGKMLEIHFYGRKLIGEKKNKEALEVFKINAKKNPKQYTTYMGLARGLSANGDFKGALVNARLALPLAPDEFNKKSVENILKKLEAGKDIN
jgi:tetratricopeptide (TPR) repeat protein